MSNGIDHQKRSLLRGKLTIARVLRLPWIKSEQEFIQGCTQCQDCISACETNIITRDAAGFPTIDFSKGECTFCQKCVQTCQEPLFVSVLNENNNLADDFLPWPITLAITDKCLAKNNVYCQSCRDECESQAIKFLYMVNGKPHNIPQPQIHHEDCSQCGACVATCPQDAIITTFINQSPISKVNKIEVLNVG